MAYRYYYAAVTLVSGRGFVATFPDLPGYTACEASVDAVREAAEAGLTAHLQALAGRGDAVPQPTTAQHITRLQPAGEFRILVRGDVPGETSLRIVRENARRLVGDATLLFNLGSMASAVGFSIFAIEEVGKLFIEFEKRPGAGKRLGHERKQAVLGEKLDRLFLIETLDKIVEDFEAFLRKTGATESLSVFLNMSARERMAEVYLWLADNPAQLAKEIHRIQGANETGLEYSADVSGRKVSEKREQSLYVDIDQAGRMLASPFDITFEEAEMWMERAKFALHLADALML